MIPSAFDGENCLLDAPAAMTPEECLPLSVCALVNPDSGYPVLISCWKVTAEELETIKCTGRVWLTVAGSSMPPVMLSAECPIEQREEP